MPRRLLSWKARYFIVETRVGTGGGERERDLRFDRRSTRGSAVRVDRRRLERSSAGESWLLPFRPLRASPRLSRLADCFAPAGERRSQRRFVGWARNIPLFRTALGSTFRPRSAEGASDSSRRRPDRRTSRVSSRASAFENVEKRLITRRGRLQLALARRLATEDEKADGWTSTRRPAKP